MANTSNGGSAGHRASRHPTAGLDEDDVLV